MEENRLLDASRKALNVLIVALALCALASCTLPRIAVLHDPLTPEEHINLGVGYEKKGELDAALEQYKDASKKLPIAYLYIGNVYVQKNDVNNAEKAYRQAIRKSGDAKAYNNLAWLYCTRDEHLEEAENLARKTVELKPDENDFRDTLEKIIKKRNLQSKKN